MSTLSLRRDHFCYNVLQNISFPVSMFDTNSICFCDIIGEFSTTCLAYFWVFYSGIPLVALKKLYALILVAFSPQAKCQGLSSVERNGFSDFLVFITKGKYLSKNTWKGAFSSFMALINSEKFNDYCCSR